MFLFIKTFNQNLVYNWIRFGKGLNYSNGNSLAFLNNNLYLSGFFADSVIFQSNFLLSRGSFDIYLKKYDKSGNEYWLKQIGGTLNDNVRSLKIDKNNDLLITGHFTQNCTFDNDTLIAPTTNFFIAKYDTFGNLKFVKNITSTHVNTSWDLTIDNNNNYYIPGYFQGTATYGTTQITSNGLNDIFILKMDKNGNIKWFHNFGGIGKDEGRAILSDNSNNIVYSGIYSQTVNFQNTTFISKGGYDIFISKIDTNGNIIWIKTIGSKYDDYPSRIINDCENNYYLCGYFHDTVWFDNQMFVSSGLRDIFIAKISPDGNYIWIKTYGGIGIDSPSGFAYKNCDEMYLTGYFSSNAYFGSTLLNATDQDIFIMKFDRNGNIYWVNKIGGLGSNSSSSIYVKDQDIYLSGYYNGQQIIDNYTFNTTGNFDSFLIKFTEINSNPLPIELLSFKVICTQTGSLITWTTASETNNDYFTIEKSTDMMNWKVVSTLSSSFNSNEIKNYIIEDNTINPNELTYYRLKQTDFDGNFKYFDVYSILCSLPNNSLEIIGVNVSELNINIMLKTNGFNPVDIDFYDIYGKLITQKIINPTKGANIITLNSIHLSPGIYLISATQNGEKKTKKIILY